MSQSWLFLSLLLLLPIARVDCERLNAAMKRLGIVGEDVRRELQTINHDDDHVTTIYNMSVCTTSSENTCGLTTCCYYTQSQDDDAFDKFHYHENCIVTPGSGFTGTCTWHQTGQNTYVCTTNYNSCINPSSQPSIPPTAIPSMSPSYSPSKKPSNFLAQANGDAFGV